jgi:hypothetical protein
MKKTKSNNSSTVEIYSVLFEMHNKECHCSYCHGRETKLHYGLNIPKHWNGCHAWYIVKFYPGFYIRWTNRWFKRVSQLWKKITFEK